MDVKDLLIIYLAAGAPFAVYYFFRYRSTPHGLVFWFKLAFRFFVWFPYALLAAHRFLTPKVTKKFPSRHQEISSASDLKDDILVEFASRRNSHDFFEAKEVIERYVALTNAKNNFASDTLKRENDLFKVALRSNTELAARCLHRKNRELVFRHQEQAQNDLYNLCALTTDKAAPKGKISQLTLALTRLLKDNILEEKISGLSLSASSESAHKDLNNYHLKPAR